MTLGEKLQTLRTGAELSQEDLAEKLGVSRQAVSKWELDKTVPDVKYIVELSNLFRVSTDYLLKDRKTVPPPGTCSPEKPPPDTAPTPPTEEPLRVRAACILLSCGNTLCLLLLLMYLVKYLLFRRDSGWLLAFILLLAPLLAGVSRGLLWRGPLAPTVLRRYRRGVANSLVLMGFSLIMPFGFNEVIDDLLVGQVGGHSGHARPFRAECAPALALLGLGLSCCASAYRVSETDIKNPPCHRHGGFFITLTAF